jgi:hypothetical protein
VEVRKKLPGLFSFVRPSGDDHVLQLGGYPSDQDPFTVITLDDRLDEIRRIDAGRRLDFIASMTYRSQDQSLVLFGSGINRFGERLTSRVLYLDPGLRSERTLDLAHAPFADGGIVRVGIPTGRIGEVMAARSLVKLGSDPRPIGAALDFIQVVPTP